ncbi:hypothetical protein N0V88_008070 [Collariella sp. IMI 366227]|nr:hypothetical protein N0V88_008070 [Collariella sp. IMI 366227]
MRLLRTDTLVLVEFIGRVPPYVILSHTWSSDEVTFEDLSLLPRAAVMKKVGYAKLLGCSSRAAADGAELSEAINSMYRWYSEAHICYAYMSDVALDTQSYETGSSTIQNAQQKEDSESSRPSLHTIPSILRDYDKLPRTFENSRWFTRGWTLQELIAPPIVEFYTKDWGEIGTKFSLRRVIKKITGIDIRVLEGADPTTCHVAERMSWAANRQTTRIEDAAYCLLGIFKVHMPLIYGEGHRAFYRLQKEIMKTTEDYTMLAWGLSKYLSNKHHWKGIQPNKLEDPRRPLADSPNDFELHNRDVWTYSRLIPDDGNTMAARISSSMDDTPPLITSRGLRVSLLLKPSRVQPGDILAYINCRTTKPGTPMDGLLTPVCLVLRRQENSSIYTGTVDPNAAFELLDSVKALALFERKTIYLSLANVDTALSQIHNHRMASLEKNLYILDRPPALRVGDSAFASGTAWKITSCFSHALGSGPGHVHYEAPRKFSAASLFQPFDLPPSTIRIFAFEHPRSSSSTFGIVVGHGWCDLIPINDTAFRARWGLLVHNGQWNETLTLKYIVHVALESKCADESSQEGEPVDRVVRRIADFTISVSLKKVRKADINCQSAIKIIWSTDQA